MNTVLYKTVEFLCQNGAEYLEIESADGDTRRVKTFLYQPIERTYGEVGIETVTSCGEPECRARVCFDSEGEYKVYEASGEEKSLIDTVKVEKGEAHGFVKISEKDPRYFAYSDNTAFMPIGVNVTFPTVYGSSTGAEFGRSNTFQYCGIAEYERWLKSFAKNGCNLIRIWCGCDYFCPDTREAGVFNYEKFSLLDEIFALAEKYDLKLKLTIEQFRYFDYREKLPEDAYAADIYRKFSKQLELNGERCENMDEFLTEEKWKNSWLCKVEEYAARYAENPRLFALEFWNEMNCVAAEKENLYSWNREMAEKVKALFPNTMVINSLGSYDTEAVARQYAEFPFDSFDFKQIHRYVDMGAKLDVCKGHPALMAADAIRSISDGKAPAILAETGAVEACHSGTFKYYTCDHRGIILADTVYSPLFAGSGACGNIWHWDSRYIEAKNLYYLFAPLSELVKGVEFDAEGFENEVIETDDAIVLLLKGKSVTLGYIRNKQDTWQNVLRDGNEVSAIDVNIAVGGRGGLEVYPLWEDCEVEEKGGKIAFSGLKYGALFKKEK